MANSINDTIIWSDVMESNNEDDANLYITSGTVNTPIQCPLNSNDLCWSIMSTNSDPNPYFYRLIDIPSFQEIFTLNIEYDIIPWNLSPNMQCEVYYAVLTEKHTFNINWNLFAQYDDAQNGDDLSSESYKISITNTSRIGIKFRLYNNNKNKNVNLIGVDEHSACYLSYIKLTVKTEIIPMDADIVLFQDANNDVSGDLTVEILILIGFGTLLVATCFLAVIVLISCYCINIAKKKDKELEKYKERVRKHMEFQHELMSSTNPTNTSLQIGGANVIIDDEQNKLNDDDDDDNNDKHNDIYNLPSLKTQNSLSQVLSQIIYKTTNFEKRDKNYNNDDDQNEDDQNEDDQNEDASIKKSVILGDLQCNELGDEEKKNVSETNDDKKKRKSHKAKKTRKKRKCGSSNKIAAAAEPQNNVGVDIEDLGIENPYLMKTQNISINIEIDETTTPGDHQYGE